MKESKISELILSPGTSDLSVQDSSALSTALEEKGYLVKELFMSQAHTEVPDYYIPRRPTRTEMLKATDTLEKLRGSTGTSRIPLRSLNCICDMVWFLSYDDGVAVFRRKIVVAA